MLMEWNKDEAVKAKEIAEKKIMQMDVNGALRFAMKAQNMYPTLDGLPQLLATLNIYVSADHKINGEIDRYRVLGVQPSADEETIRKSYRKLAFILHPDKNKAVGADGAFKILSEAWSVLSDKNKRLSYDEKRSWGTTYQKFPNGKLSMPHKHNHIFRPSPSAQSVTPNNWGGATHPSSAQASAPHPPPYKCTFWTFCNACKMKFEFMTQYVNRHLRCPNCPESFMAVENGPPPVSSRSSLSAGVSSMLEQNSSRTTESASLKGQLFGKADEKVLFGTGLSCSYPRPFGVLPQFGSVRPFPSPASSTGWFHSTIGLESVHRDHISLQTDGGAVSMSSKAGSSSRLEAGGPRKKGRPLESGIKYKETRTSWPKSSITRELAQPEARNLLMQKARTEIRGRLREWTMKDQVAVGSFCTKKKVMEHPKELRNAFPNGVQADFRKSKEPTVKVTVQAEEPPSATCAVDMETDSIANLMSVPDPDFYNFDKNRVESSFSENQIWAVYDDDDGMPRYYALIHNLISAKPFKMRISWLSSKSNLEFSPIKWVGSGFAKTCGHLRIGKSEVYDSLNTFSHRVKWTKGPRGIIQIYPTRGDVWALYRNWSPDWNELTSDEIIHKYDMVEVLEDYSADCGVSVAPLLKVPGFSTVFRKYLDPGKIWTIPTEEMFRFSHQVPSYKLSGEEAAHAPKGCWELDPASTPLELLQVVTECSREDVLVGPEIVKGEVMGNGHISMDLASLKDAGKNILEETKAGGMEQRKELLVYERRRKRKKQNDQCRVTS